MKERPILFNGEMVRAILSGKKTQTRRIVKGKWVPVVEECLRVNGRWVWDTMDYELTTPFGQPGDRLWVRETSIIWLGLDGKLINAETGPVYQDDPEYLQIKRDAKNGAPWETVASIHMPRWASRLTLEITGVRVERIQDISASDAEAEGISVLPLQDEADPSAWWQSSPGNNQARSALKSFGKLWESAYPGSWERNDWVWVIEFKKEESPND